MSDNNLQAAWGRSCEPVYRDRAAYHLRGYELSVRGLWLRA